MIGTILADAAGAVAAPTVVGLAWRKAPAPACRGAAPIPPRLNSANLMVPAD
jgi:hypothetical protein